jgi:hypothetical protein
LREQLLSQLKALQASETLLAWAKATLPLKNTLLETDARLVECAYQTKLEDLTSSPGIDVEPAAEPSPELLTGAAAGTNPALQPSGQETLLTCPKEPPRKRSKQQGPIWYLSDSNPVWFASKPRATLII